MNATSGGPPAGRRALALLATPLAPFFLYYGFYSLLSSQSPESPSASAFFFAIVPVAYAITLTVWAPLSIYLERKRYRESRHFATSGGILGLTVGCAITVLGGQTLLDPQMLFFLLVALLIGALYGLCYWVLAYLRLW